MQFFRDITRNFKWKFLAENLCTPGTFFKMNCNTCTCSADGRNAACTDMACPPVENANVNDIDTVQARKFYLLLSFSIAKTFFFFFDKTLCVSGNNFQDYGTRFNMLFKSVFT